MGHVPLEQAGVPDQELMEPHGVSRVSRSKDNGPLELGPLYGGPSRAFIQRIPDSPSGGGPQLGPQTAGLSLALKRLVPAGTDRALNR